MKITFQPTEALEIGKQNTTKQSEVKNSGKNYACAALFGRNLDENWIGGKKSGKEKGKTLAEIQQEAGVIDVGVQQDYKTLLSHTMSAEDYAKLEEEGFDFSTMDPDTAVTIVDKIKAELARCGQHIAGYTDDLDTNTLAAALGSESLASAVSDSFQEADIPLTEENIEGVKKAWDMAEQLQEPTESSYLYMVDNGMEPKIWNFYLAQSSGAMHHSNTEQGGGLIGQPRFYAEDIEGYYTESAKGNLGENLQEEIDKLLMREEMEPNEENRQAAQTLLDGGIPITKENLLQLQKLQEVQFPVSEITFAHAAAIAISEGKDPIYSNLVEGKNIYENAIEILDYFQNEVEQVLDLEDIISRRQLEEIRLRMTAEVNVKLIKSGFAINTAPMEQLVEALRKAEAEVAAKYFPQDTEAVSKYQLYHHINEVVKELPTLPAQLLGTWSVQDHIGTLETFHAEGKALQGTYEKAQKSYETLMTAPRKDLGDTIQKAFTNVDDILTDIGLDTTQTNRRAVRILGYNRMNITAANVQRVQLADAQVQSVIEKMTPASTLKMIRDGQNPLEMNFAELQEYFDSIPVDYESSSESYSRFLYGLEQNKQITEQERTAYIGIYRMLHQIDASDGAVIGALVNVGAELHFSNLLSAVRSGKFQAMDVSVTEEFGGTVELIRKGESISDQIAKGFVQQTKEILTQVSYTQEAAEDYRQMELQQLRQAATVDSESVEMLLRGKLPQSAENLLAAQALSDKSYHLFKEWKLKKAKISDIDAKKMGDISQTEGEDADAIITGLTESLENKEAFQAQFQEMLDVIDSEVQEISLTQADTSMDVRSMRLLHKQLSVAGRMAQEEEYIFPMYIGEELTRVHLTLEKGAEEKGSVSIAVTISQQEHLEGHFHAQDGKITGFLVGNTEKMVTKLKDVADIFISSVQNGLENKWEIDSLPVVNRQDKVTSPRRQGSVNKEVPDNEEAYKDVDNTELYRIAKVFLEAVQK